MLPHFSLLTKIIHIALCCSEDFAALSTVIITHFINERWGTFVKAFEPIIPSAFAQIYDSYQFAPAVRIGNDIHVSGVVGFNEDGTFPPDFKDQARNVFRLMEVVLAECGGSLRDVFSMTSYHVGDLPKQMRSLIEEKTSRLGTPHPAWTAVSVSGLAVPEAILEIAAIARLSV